MINIIMLRYMCLYCHHMKNDLIIIYFDLILWILFFSKFFLIFKLWCQIRIRIRIGLVSSLLEMWVYRTALIRYFAAQDTVLPSEGRFCTKAIQQNPERSSYYLRCAEVLLRTAMRFNGLPKSDYAKLSSLWFQRNYYSACIDFYAVNDVSAMTVLIGRHRCWYRCKDLCRFCGRRNVITGIPLQSCGRFRFR